MDSDKKGEIDIETTSKEIAEELFQTEQPAKQEEEPPLEAPVEEPVEAAPKVEEPPKVEAAPEPIPVGKTAPKSWSKEMGPEFSKLAPGVQDYILKREEDFTNGISQYKSAAEYAKAVHSVVSPYMPHIDSRGVSVGDHIRTLLSADYILSAGSQSQKLELVKNIMNHSGLTVEMLGQETPARSPSEMLLEKRLEETNNRLSEFERATLEETRAKIEKAVDTFASDPKNVYFSELSDDIVKLIGAGYTLEDAYEKAVWANPATRAKEQARLLKEAEAKSKKDAEEAAVRAKRAARSNVKETPSSRSSPTGILGSMDDTLRSTLQNIRERT